NTPFKINHFSKFVEVLSTTQSLVYLGDNTGEIVFDKLLLETILERYKIERIRFAVKGAPIINDATIEDAKYVGLDKIPGLEFIKIGIGIPGSGLERWDTRFLKILRDSNMVISKGQGNYEALSDQKGIFFLLLAKCPVIARDLGVEVGDIVLKGV
ncbi:MAG: damage-control phosphatase ARMT1 family protein, partial [Candidatus Helarchaeota archaeon]